MYLNNSTTLNRTMNFSSAESNRIKIKEFNIVPSNINILKTFNILNSSPSGYKMNDYQINSVFRDNR